MDFLITGGAGFLGSHLSDALVERGDRVTVLDVADDLKVRHLLGHPGFKYVRGSILDRDIVAALVPRCDAVYHLAAVVGVQHYVGNPYKVLDVNVNGTQNVLEAALAARKKVIFSSTSEVYGTSARVPFVEDGERVLGSTRTDRWSYSTSKAVGEHFCFAFEKLGLPVVVLRYFNVYGPRLDRMDSGRVMTIFLGQLLRGLPLTVIGDGEQTRCFTYVDDAVEATVTAGVRDAAVGQIINVGCDEETSINKLAAVMIELSGLPAATVFVPGAAVYGQRYEDVRRRVPDLRRMRQILGCSARIPLATGLKLTIQSFLDQNGDGHALTPEAYRRTRQA